MKPHRVRRVIVYGMPRSASSVTLELICQRFGLQNFGEINNPDLISNQRFASMYSPARLPQTYTPEFSDVPQGADMVPWLHNREPWAVKFLTNHLGLDLLQYLIELQPNYVIITQPQDAISAFLSLCWAQQYQIYHHRGRIAGRDHQPQWIDPVLAHSWINNILIPYQRDRDAIQASDLPWRIWNKEHIENNGELELDGIFFSISEFRGRTRASGIDYQSWCKNIGEIKEVFDGYHAV